MLPPFLRIDDEVRAALEDGAPLVALESSIVAHGFPAPENLRVGHEMVAAVRAGGALPAQVAVLDGVVKVGLDDDDLERLATQPALKCSSRDLAYAVSARRLGATTVAATARIAALAGLRVFATGGIGGVHRGQDALDVSADLLELSRSPVAVISSGAKSILDLPATLEALEALGVPVIGYGCRAFPAFHAVDSGLALAQQVDDATALARLMAAHWSLVPEGGLLICHPPPADTAMARHELEALVARALADAQGVHGPALTPFLLQRLNDLSGGRTLRINHALAVANAGAGARIACAYADLARP